MIRILRNQEILGESQNGVETQPTPSPPSRNEALGKTLKNYEKADLKIFCSCPILLGFLLLARYF